MERSKPDEVVENLRAAVSEQSSRAIEGHNAIAEKLGEVQSRLDALTETAAGERAACHSLAAASQDQLKALEENMPEPMSEEDAQRLANADTALAEKGEALSAAAARVEDLERSVSEKEEAAQELRSQVSRLEQEAGGLQAAAQAARHRVEQLEKSASENSEVGDTARLRTIEIEKTLVEKTESAEAARARVAHLEKELQSIRDQGASDDFTALQNQAKVESEAAKERIEALEAEASALRDESAGLREAAQSAAGAQDGKSEEFRKLLQVEKARADSLQALLDEERGEGTKSVLAQQLAEALRSREDAQEELVELRQEMARLRDSGEDDKTESDTQAKIRAAAAVPGDEARRKMGDILVDAGVISAEQLDIALAEQRASENTRLGVILVDLRMASEEAVAQALAFQRNVEFVRIKSDTVQRDAARLISGRLAEHHGCLPISALNQRLTLAMINPLDLIAIEDVERATDYTVEPVVATASEIFSAIKEIYAS